MQEVGNVPNFTMIVKMQSAVTLGNQAQGVLIEGNQGEFIRIDLNYDLGRPDTDTDDTVKYFAGVVNGTSGNIKRNQPITLSGSDIYLRIQRAGNEWRLFYRFTDSGQWTGVGKFNHSMVVERIGVFAASGAPKSASRPGHTAVFDYLFNAETPITPEDGDAPSLTVTNVGQGTVTQTPAGPNYTCGQQVQLQAKPANGWAFQNWSGNDLNGSNPTRTLTITGRHAVTATFVQRTRFDLFLPVAIR
jgi:hypothetical protein